MPSSAYTPPTVLFSLSLHDALPISCRWLQPAEYLLRSARHCGPAGQAPCLEGSPGEPPGRRRDRLRGDALRCGGGRGVHSRRGREGDRKSTRLNSSHRCISYAVFCLYTAHRALLSFPTRRSSDLLSLASTGRISASKCAPLRTCRPSSVS